MTQYETKHGTLTIQFFEHPLIGRMIELRTETAQVKAIQAKDHHVQSYIIKAGNNVEQGMNDFFRSVLTAFNKALTEFFKGDDFVPVSDLLEDYESRIAWNGEGFELKEAP